MFAPAEAVRFLDDAHRSRARYQNIPAAIAPTTVAEAYDVQEALCARWAERLRRLGWWGPALALGGAIDRRTAARK